MRASVRGNLDKNQGRRSKPKSTLAARKASEMLNIVLYVVIALLFSCILALVWVLVL